MTTHLFISWSGKHSKIAGRALRDWLPKVLPTVKPWMSAVDISSGARWGPEIARQLEKSKMGILCVTRDNLHAPWIFFEAGALSKAVSTSMVCPYLVGIEPSELVGPLKQFHASKADKASTLQLVETINKLTGNKVSEMALKAAFETEWPGLDSKLRRLRVITHDVRYQKALGSGPWQKLQPLDFSFIWGNLTDSEFKPALVQLERTEKKWAPPAAIAGLAWKSAYERAEAAAARRQDFYFKPLERVQSARVRKDGVLVLTLELTMYMQFAATNLALEKNLEFRDAVKKLSGEYAHDHLPFLSSALNVVGCLVSKDDYLFLPKRGPKVFEKPNKYQASTGGFVERTDLTPDRAFSREIGEELNIEPHELKRIVFLGFGNNEVTGEPDILALADCTLRKQEIVKRFHRVRKRRIQNGKDPGELADLCETDAEAKASGSQWKSVWRLDISELPDLFRFLRSHGEWSQPSDRAAVIAALCRKLGQNRVRQALDNWKPHIQ